MVCSSYSNLLIIFVFFIDYSLICRFKFCDLIYLESSEDILAKYRKKPSNMLNIINDKNSSQKSGINKNDEGSVSEVNKNVDLETFSFDDAKKKLRLVLSTVDIQYVPWCNETESKPMVKY